MTNFDIDSYMGVVSWASCNPDAFVSPTQGGFTQNLALIGQAVSEMSEIMEDDYGWLHDHGYTISSPGEPSAQVS